MEVVEMNNKKWNQSKKRVAMLLMACLLVGCFGSSSVLAATSDIPEKGWDRLVGGTRTDSLSDIVATGDGGTISVGSTTGNDRYDKDGFIIKTDNRGTTVWSKRLGGTGTDELKSVALLADGSVLVAGSSESTASETISDVSNGNMDGLLAKYDADGNKQWDRLIGGTQLDEINSVIPTADGGFLAVGMSYSSQSGTILDINNGFQTTDGYIVKFDAAGAVEWDNLFGSPEFDRFYDVIQTADGGFIAAGTAASADRSISGGEITDVSLDQLVPQDGLLVKFDAAGDMVWNNLYGSRGFDRFYAVASTMDGGFVAIGETTGNDGDLTTGSSAAIPDQSNGLITKFDSAGAPSWNCVFASGDYASLSDVIQTTDGNYLAAGITGGTSDGFGGGDGMLVKIGDSGNLIATSIIGGARYEGFNAIAIDDGGCLNAAGYSSSSRSGSILYKSNGGQDGLLVHFGQTQYQVDFQTNGSDPLDAQTIWFGDSIVAPEDPTKSGYNFEGWYLDEAFNDVFLVSDPIVEDTTLHAKWYLTVDINPVVSDDPSITGIGQPGLQVAVTLPNGTKIKEYTQDDGTWTVELPKGIKLKGGDLIRATLHDPAQEFAEVSNDTEVVKAAPMPPDTGDAGSTIPLALFGCFLGLMIMVGVFKGPKTNR